MISVACLPADLGDIPGTDVRFDLYSHSRIGDRGRVGNRVPGPLQKLGLRPPAIAWDFTTFALAAVAADETAPRDRSPDGWTREIALTIAVTDPDLWNGQAAVLTTALRFLSGDIWHINFVGHGIAPTGRGRERLRPENLVCLLSGGMDSLVGAIDVVREGHQPLLVSQIAKGDSADQRWFAQTIAPSSLHLQLNHHARPPGRSERSQRARSLAFLGFGVLAASCTTAYRDGIEVELRIPENGFISQNVPLTPMRTGSLSTKTTHPYFLALMQDACAPRVCTCGSTTLMPLRLRVRCFPRAKTSRCSPNWLLPRRVADASPARASSIAAAVCRARSGVAPTWHGDERTTP